MLGQCRRHVKTDRGDPEACGHFSGQQPARAWTGDDIHPTVRWISHPTLVLLPRNGSNANYFALNAACWTTGPCARENRSERGGPLPRRRPPIPEISLYSGDNAFVSRRGGRAVVMVAAPHAYRSATMSRAIFVPEADGSGVIESTQPGMDSARTLTSKCSDG